MDLPVHQNGQQNSRQLRPQRLPPWLKKKLGSGAARHRMKERLRSRGLHTVCEEASCPNLGECWSVGTASFMILGDICTRHCAFCDVTAGVPRTVNENEPTELANIVSLLELKHVVVTCVARDDLEDRGAGQFIRCIGAVREESPGTVIEILTTDFSMLYPEIDKVLAAEPDVFNHNIETVERLSNRVRSRATYQGTLQFLSYLKERNPRQTTKSGLMVGLGETREEVIQTLADLRRAACDIVTIGQYLRPARRNLPVVEFVKPELFEEYEAVAQNLGFRSVASGPFVRSSYQAEKLVLGASL